MECLDEHVGAGLGGRVRAVGAQRGGFHEVTFGTQGAVDFVGRDLQILLALFPGLGGGVIPGVLAALQQVHGAQHVALDEDLGVLDAAVNVALGGKVDDIIGVILGDQVGDQGLVADVALHEDVAGVALDVLQVLQVAGVGQLVQIDEADVLVLLQHVMHKVGADETGTAGNKIGFHNL